MCFRLVSLKPLPLRNTSGYVSVRSSYTDIDECKEADNKKEDLCGVKGTCENSDGSYWCVCPKGYTNYGNKRTTCSGE